MTAKEKASNLVFIFGKSVSDLDISWKQAKELAIIAVDEILNEYWAHDTDRRDYWQEVKQEIEKL